MDVIYIISRGEEQRCFLSGELWAGGAAPPTFVEDDVERLLEVLHVGPQAVQIDCVVCVTCAENRGAVRTVNLELRERAKTTRCHPPLSIYLCVYVRTSVLYEGALHLAEELVLRLLAEGADPRRRRLCLIVMIV